MKLRKTRSPLEVMIAACDTFRSGAVEQLEEHGKRLNVPVYNKGGLCTGTYAHTHKC